MIPNALVTYMTYRFATNLSKPFKEWPAYEMGLIDEKGVVLRKAKTSEERAAMNAANNLVRKIKRILLHFTRDNRMLNFIIAAYLVKESSRDADQSKFFEMVDSEFDCNEKESLFEIVTKLSKQEKKNGNNIQENY